MGKKKYIIEVDDLYIMDLYGGRELLCPIKVGVKDGKNVYLNTGFTLEEYREPEEPKDKKAECPYRVGQIVVNNVNECLMVITRINDDMTVNAMDSDGCFHICSILDLRYTAEHSTALWLTFKVLQELENREDNKNE